MKKGTVFEGIVKQVKYPNRGLVETEGGLVTVKNVIPGQRIRGMLTKAGRDRLEGRLLEILERSPEETGKVCRQFGICGGCTYLSMDYQAQKALKEEQVKSNLDHALAGQSVPYVWEGVQESPCLYEYRNKMEFTFGNEYKDGPLSLGMHKRGSFFDVVPVEDCLLVDGDYRLILKTVKNYFAEKEISFFHRMTHEGYLRHLLVRKSRADGKILVALVTTTQIPDDGELIKGFLDALLELQSNENDQVQSDGKPGTDDKLKGSFAGILHVYNDSPADVVRSDRTEILYGRDMFGEKLLGLDFQVSMFSFFQTNSAGAEVIYRTVQRYVEGARLEQMKKPVVFDLYSGTGTIAQLMAPVADKVIGVEIVEEAVDAAKRSAAANHLDNCQFLAGDVLKVLDEIEEKPDFIILDPPREGIHPKALPKILDYGVENLVYVSCKLSSLVNDLKTFRARGYEVVRATAVDQFPWTANMETVCLLSNTQRPKKESYITLDVEMEDYYRIKNEGKNSTT